MLDPMVLYDIIGNHFFTLPQRTTSLSQYRPLISLPRCRLSMNTTSNAQDDADHHWEAEFDVYVWIDSSLVDISKG